MQPSGTFGGKAMDRVIFMASLPTEAMLFLKEVLQFLLAS
jgi:hypothetical protein